MRDPANRARLKLPLVRRHYERGFERQDILDLFRLIDWQIRLPADLADDFQRGVEELEKEKARPYVTRIERLGIPKGCQEGRIEAAHETIREALLPRFGRWPQDFPEALAAVSDPGQLRSWHRLAITALSLEAFADAIQGRASAML